VSPRRNASLVVALGVASLAAMVATRELLVESFGRPVPERLDPPYPGLRSPEVIQVDPPERKRAKPPTDRARAPAGAPPPRREPVTRPRRGPAPEAGRAGVVGVGERRPARRRLPRDRRHHREGSGEDEVGHWPGERKRWRDGEERRPAWNGDRSRPRGERLFSDLEVTDQPR
jgi:hypothetical protein